MFEAWILKGELRCLIQIGIQQQQVSKVKIQRILTLLLQTRSEVRTFQLRGGKGLGVDRGTKTRKRRRQHRS